MAPTTSIPGSVVAGDSVHWTRTFQDYRPSDGWTLAYSIVGPTAVYTVNGVANAAGDGFDVDVAATTSKTWAAGIYRVAEIVSNATDRVTLSMCSLAIAPDPTAAGAYMQSHAQKVLAAIEAWLESKAPTAGALEINGRKIQYFPLTELLALRDKYAAMVKRELQCATTGVSGTRILVRL